MINEWAVIGAGPAGICAVGKLIDNGISPNKIIWIDPEFKVGDFGTLWCHAPSNTKVKFFLKFLNACRAFNYKNLAKDFPLNHVDEEDTCSIQLVTDPLYCVTQELKKQVQTKTDHAKEIVLRDGLYEIICAHTAIKSKNVILAIGSEPKTLSYPKTTMIPLQDAIDSERLKSHLNADDTIAVFGSSHSAVLVLMNLMNSKVKRVINFYRSPLRYAVYVDDWILFDDSGLKGKAAVWAKEHIDSHLPANLSRIPATEENIKQHLPECTKVIYAVGFERRQLPSIHNFENVKYIEQCGIIAPGLFGFGIAFPEAKVNPIGILEHRVGLWKFMDYMERMLPIWTQYSL